MNPKHFRELVIRPTLKDMDMWSEAAENLLLGTAAQESQLNYLKQNGGVPALGFYQIEPATNDDIWERWLGFRPPLASKVRGYVAQHPTSKTFHDQLITNLVYATAMARLKYWRVPDPLPDPDNIYALGEYWNDHYNCNPDHGTAEEFVINYRIHAESKSS